MPLSVCPPGCRRYGRWPLRAMYLLSLLQVVHSKVAVEIVHLEECMKIFYLRGGWPQQMIGLQVWNPLGLTSCHGPVRLETARRACSGIGLFPSESQCGPCWRSSGTRGTCNTQESIRATLAILGMQAQWAVCFQWTYSLFFFAPSVASFAFQWWNCHCFGPWRSAVWPSFMTYSGFDVMSIRFLIFLSLFRLGHKALTTQAVNCPVFGIS